jgi:hypothetical protein
MLAPANADRLNPPGARRLISGKMNALAKQRQILCREREVIREKAGADSGRLLAQGHCIACKGVSSLLRRRDY